MEDVVAQHFEKLADYRSFALVFPVEPTFIEYPDDKESNEPYYSSIKLFDEDVFAKYVDDFEHLAQEIYLDGKSEGYYMRKAGKHKSGEGFYRAGKMEGRFTSYFWRGKKQEEGEYRDGKRVGKWTSWDYKGNVLVSIEELAERAEKIGERAEKLGKEIQEVRERLNSVGERADKWGKEIEEALSRF